MAANPIKITDTTFRDAHQSLMATRLRIADMEPIAADMDSLGLHSVEVWGGATFDAATRYLAEDPWDRLRTFKRLMPKTPLMMLLRGQNLVGYRNYANDIVDAFVQRSAETGIDIFRVFDALNDERNVERAIEAIKASGKHLQMAICYSVTEGRMGGPIYNLDYFVGKARRFQEMGADSICLKDMGGVMAPYDAYELVTTLKEILSVPLQLHTHYTSGMASMTVLKAIEAGIDVVDACLAPLALRTSQPAVEPLVVALRDNERQTNLDLDKLIEMGDYLESVLPKYSDHMRSPRAAVIDTKVLSHQIPGGMASNLVSQLREAGALDRLDEVLRDIVVTRKELGYPPLVTPVSQMVGSQAVSNVLFGRYKMVSGQVKDYFYGLYGRPPAQVDADIQRLVLKDYERGQEPTTAAPSELVEPEMERAREAVRELSTDIEDVLTYALYPTTGLRFLRIKHGLDPVPDEMKPPVLDEEAPSGSDAVSKTGPLRVEAPARSARARLFNVYVGDDFFQIEVDPARPSGAVVRGPSARVEAVPAQATPGQPGPPSSPASAETTTITAPMPGIVLRYVVEVGQKVAEGESVVVLEAMKMENVLPSPIAGTISSLPLQEGSAVRTGDVLAAIAI
ncbi:MAG: pyruvate carboxylase subunit B [Chloroflexi bacterium]|nr:pyruvate carboxylase subunit B [Chloroflexota bacterium]